MPGGAPRPPGAPGAPPVPGAPPPGAPKKTPKKPGVPMKQLHWGKIPDAKIKGTMWENDIKDDKIGAAAAALAPPAPLCAARARAGPCVLAA